MNDNKIFIELVLNIKIRGRMYVEPENYNTVISYIKGFNYCLSNMKRENSMFLGFEEWLQLKLGYKTSLVWDVIILNLMCENDDNAALNLFFDLYKEFYYSVIDKGLIEEVIKKRNELNDDYITFFDNDV